MNVRHAVVGSLLVVVHFAAAACDLPALVVIPAQEPLGDRSAEVIVATQRYVTAIKEYATCVQAELTAAGGDAAPASLRNQLIGRNNHAIAEAESVLELFRERVAPPQVLYLAEFATGEGAECIQTPRLESTAVINDIAVLFVEQSGRTYLNVLEESCTDLERFGYFRVNRNIIGRSDVSRLGPGQTSRLCSNEFIEPYAFDTNVRPNRDCGLGLFFDITEEQGARLMALRGESPAAATADAARRDDPAEGTPAPRRSER
jgi:hypothetical protein